MHVFGRRGPTAVKFTPLELRELGELNDVDMVVYDEDFDYDEHAQAAIKSNKQVMVMDRVLQSWRQRPGVNNAGGEASRRLHLHFFAKPVELRTDASGRVSSFVYERTVSDGEGGVVGTGEMREIELQAMYRAVGYFGSPLPGVPFDDQYGVIPNDGGKVLDPATGEQVPGTYATGWIKRGPVGLIGHTKSDAMETIGHVIADQATWWTPEAPDERAVTELLESRGVRWTDLEGWHRLDEHELGLGAAQGRERVKVVPRDEMINISRGE